MSWCLSERWRSRLPASGRGAFADLCQWHPTHHVEVDVGQGQLRDTGRKGNEMETVQANVVLKRSAGACGAGCS